MNYVAEETGVVLDEAEVRIALLEAQIDATVAALVAWGHDSRCDAASYLNKRVGANTVCDCGMDKIVADLRGGA